MTNTETGLQVLKTDALGRVRTPAPRREELLDEFEKSGASGQQFAELAGIKYQTFATWVQQRRRQRGATGQTKVVKDPAATVRWLEAVVGKATDHDADSLLPVQLPGGARLEISSARQIPLAAALLRALEKPAATC
jgi:hypothetical protein